MHSIARGLVFAAVLAGAGCSRRHAAAPSSSSPPDALPAAETDADAQGGDLDRRDLNVRLKWPAGWVRRPSDDFALFLTPPRRTADSGASLSLEVPDLPPHFPGLIPINSVRGGYLDDLRKEAGPLQTADLPSPAIRGAAVRLVRSAWTDPKGQSWQETALLLVHGDRVYILRGRSQTSDEPATRAAFDEIAKSLEWTR